MIDPKIAEQINQLLLENEDQRRTILRLEAQYGVLLEMRDQENAKADREATRLQKTINELMAERDELRREVCQEATSGETIGAALLYADSRGWDCFSYMAEANANNAAFRKNRGK